MINKIFPIVIMMILVFASCTLENKNFEIEQLTEQGSLIDASLSKGYKHPGFSLRTACGKLQCIGDIYIPSGIGSQYNLHRAGSNALVEIRWGRTVTFSHNFNNDCQGDYYVKHGVWNNNPANGETFGWTEERKYISVCNGTIIYNERE